MILRFAVGTLAVSIAATLVACSSRDAAEPPASTGHTSSDSAGIAIVTSTMPALADDAWTVEADPVVAIGAVAINKVVGATRLPDGRIAILNGDPTGVMIFERGGNLVRHFAKSGDGPGELRAPVHLRLVGDTLRVWGAMYGPAYGFDTSGTLLTERQHDLRRIRASLGGVPTETHLPAPGHGLIAVGGTRDRGPTLTSEWIAGRGTGCWTLISDAYDATLLGCYPGSLAVTSANPAGGVRTVLPPVFTMSHVTVGGRPTRFYASPGDQYVVDVRDMSGRVVRSIRKEGPPARWDDASGRRIRAEQQARYEGLFGAAEARAALRLLPDPTIYPAVNGLLVDKDGMLWVRESLHRWSVFDAAGVWTTTIQLPLTRVFEIGSDYVLGVSQDPDGVESVVELWLGRGTQEM